MGDNNTATQTPSPPVTERSLDRATFIEILRDYLENEDHKLSLWFLRRGKPDSKISVFVNTPQDIGAALDTYRATHDCYWAVGTRSAEYAQKHPELRGGNNDVTGLIGANLDIDIYDSVAHAKKNLPRTIEEALEIANAMPIRPSMIICTGHGIQLFYLFKELMPLSGPEDRHIAEEVCMRVHAHAAHIAAKRGWVVDSTHDLARVLRVPGTVNRKNPNELVDAYIMEHNEHVRYPSFDDILDTLPPLDDASKQGTEAVPDDIREQIAALNMPGSVDRAALVHACTSSRKFKRTWERKRPDLKDQSNSGIDMALADQAVKQGWPPNQILGLLTLFAQTHKAEIKPFSYYKHTIRKAYEWRTEKEAGQDNQSAEPEPKSSDSGPIPAGKRNATLTKIGGSFRRVGADEGEIFTKLMEINVARCTPPLDEGKVRRIAQSLVQYEPVGHPYFESNENLFYRKFMKDGTCVEVKLANFTARITGNLKEDDGQETRHLFEIKVKQLTRLATVTVPADRFSKTDWAIEALGAKAIITPGPMMRDHVRAAVQYLSADTLVERIVYSHLGWREVGGAMVYLHAGGAIGANGLVDNIETSLPTPLQLYKLPDPSTGKELITSIEASVGLLGLAPRKITTPLFAAPFCAVLARPDFAVHMCGQTGVFKTELAALGQQWFGPDLDARHLPGSFSSTTNATEALVFAAKDSIVVVDDFAPTGSAVDVQRIHSAADRILRGQGNLAGRARMRSDASFRPPKHPRGLIITTGEDTPRGQSLRGRILIIEVSKGDVNVEKLTKCQQDAAAGLYAQAMSGYLMWLAPQYEKIKKQIKQEIEELRVKAIQDGHARTPGIIASLGVGLKYFLAFAVELGAITEEEKEELWGESWEALLDAARDQSQFQMDSEPAGRFISLIVAAIASGKAHCATKDGQRPDEPLAWGWVQKWNAQAVYEARGDRIGWVDGNDLFLEPESSFAIAQRLAQSQGESLPVTPRTLHKRLREKGVLASWDQARHTLKVRKSIEGKEIAVLHLHAKTIRGRSIPVDSEDDGFETEREKGDGFTPQTDSCDGYATEKTPTES